MAAASEDHLKTHGGPRPRHPERARRVLGWETPGRTELCKRENEKLRDYTLTRSCWFFLPEQHFRSCPVHGSSRHRPRLSQSPVLCPGTHPTGGIRARRRQPLRSQAESARARRWHKEPFGEKGPRSLPQSTRPQDSAELPGSLLRGNRAWHPARVCAIGGWSPGRSRFLGRRRGQCHSGPGHQQPGPLPGQGGWPVWRGHCTLARRPLV